jgi:C-terminal processing protease CtpA/Prc
MKYQFVTALIAGAALLPAAAEAQDNEVRVFSFGESRARIGVMVDVKSDAATDKIGARIQSVIPDGPAAKAGLEAGDIITRFNGESLAGLGQDDGMSGAGERLIELAHELDPGDEVEIQYRRGDDNHTVTVTADQVGGTFSFRSPGGNFRFGPHMEIDPDVFVRPHLQRIPEMNMLFGGGIAGLELAELNEDLAGYFGTSEGALVMKAPRDSTLALKGGDVIVAIDGRKVESPSHAMRILRSYNTGETATIEIMRRQARTSVDWTVPESHGRMFFRQPHWEEAPKLLKKKKESRA